MKEYLVSKTIFIDSSGSPVPTGELPLKLSLERPWARLSTGLSLATSLALAACGGTPGPSSKEAQPQASSSVPGVASKQLPPERSGSLRSFSSAILEQTEIPAEWVVQSLDLSAYGRPGVFTDTFSDNNRGFTINIAKEPLPSQAVNNPSVYVNGVVGVARKVFESAGQTPTSPLLWRGAIDGQDVWKFDSAGALTSALGQKYYDSRMALVKGGSGFVIGIQATDTAVKDAREFGDLRSTVYGRFLGPLKFKSQPASSSSGESIKPSLESARNITPPAPTPKPPESARPAQVAKSELLLVGEFKTWLSDRYGYKIDHPARWRFYDRPQFAFAGHRGEAFASPNLVYPFRIEDEIAYVAILSNQLVPGKPQLSGEFPKSAEELRTHVDRMVVVFNQMNKDPNAGLKVETLTARLLPKYLDGHDVWKVDLHASRGLVNKPQLNVYVMAVRNQIYWDLNVAAVPGSSTQNRQAFFQDVDKTFDKMLRSFKFTR